MRSLVAPCLALMIAAPGALRADPVAPQLSPIQGRREDAERLREQLRDVDPPRPPSVAPVGPPPDVSFDPPSTPASRVVGKGLLWIAAVLAVSGLGLHEADPARFDDAATGLIIAGAVAGGVGLSVMLVGRPARVAPMATARTAGLAISGSL
ncbi:MAG TPA: hypothetical protein VHW23_22490 [Kofleriaceae bacterium]|jgi:hypothetical protein|nr:hypothetical protein [Kofleriaceae bacterium]